MIFIIYLHNKIHILVAIAIVIYDTYMCIYRSAYIIDIGYIYMPYIL